MSELSLSALFLSSFLAATILPGGSEVVLFGVLKNHPQLYWPALTVATLGNTLGGMSSYLIGRFIPGRRKLRFLERVRRYGTPILLLSWVPVVGDALCVAAGWVTSQPLACGSVHGCREVWTLRRDRNCCHRLKRGEDLVAEPPAALPQRAALLNLNDSPGDGSLI